MAALNAGKPRILLISRILRGFFDAEGSVAHDIRKHLEGSARPADLQAIDNRGRPVPKQIPITSA